MSSEKLSELVEDCDFDAHSSSGSSADSLFDEQICPESAPLNSGTSPSYGALRTAAPIPGLFYSPALSLPHELASHLLRTCLATYFPPASRTNQIMLFGTGMFAPALTDLLDALSALLRPPALPQAAYDILFPAPAADGSGLVQEGKQRQAILNLYEPGEGITAHVDLLERYDDGIIGVSLGSGCVMKFAEVVGTVRRSGLEDRDRAQGERDGAEWEMYLPSDSIIVLTGDARYRWTHGIEKRRADRVQRLDDDGAGMDAATEWIERGLRLSITFRWLLPGALVVGEPD